MRSHVVAKGQVTNHILTTESKCMHLMCPNSMLIVAAKVTTTSNSELAFDLVAQRLHSRCAPVQFTQIRHLEENVDDWLRRDPRNGRTTDVVQCCHCVSKSTRDAATLDLEASRPVRIIWHYANDHCEPARCLTITMSRAAR